MSLGMTYSPTVPGGGAANFDQCLHTVMVIGRFQGDFLVGGGVGAERKGAMWEDISLEEYLMEEEKFNEKGAGCSSITVKKKNEKINMKKCFQLKVRSSIET